MNTIHLITIHIFFIIIHIFCRFEIPEPNELYEQWKLAIEDEIEKALGDDKVSFQNKKKLFLNVAMSS